MLRIGVLKDAGRRPAVPPRQRAGGWTRGTAVLQTLAGWSTLANAIRSDSQVAGPDPVVGPQLVGAGRIDDLALAHDVHVIDQLEGQGCILLDQKNREPFLFQLSD